MWDGVDTITPFADNEHRSIQLYLATAIHTLLDRNQGEIVLMGCNLSDRNVGWEWNYRIPDLVVALKDSAAIDRESHYQGGLDLLGEVLTPGEDPYAKLPFYGAIGTREVLLVHRDPWKLELFQLNQMRLDLAGVSEIKSLQVITSSVLPLSFQIQQGATRPTIVMTHTQTQQQ